MIYPTGKTTVNSGEFLVGRVYQMTNSVESTITQ